MTAMLFHIVLHAMGVGSSYLEGRTVMYVNHREILVCTHVHPVIHTDRIV